MTKFVFLISVALLVCAGCATGGGLTRKDVLKQYQEVGKLSTQITQAEADGAKVLAPEGFALAKEQLEEAIGYATDAKKAKANVAAENGLGTLTKVKRHMEESLEVMEEVLATRERARKAGAPGLFSKKYEKLEDGLKKATILVEKDRADKARKLRPDLLDEYSELELKALKKGSVAAAKAAIQRADSKDASKYAPKTLMLAEEEVKLVSSVLEADRTQTEKADTHAQRVIWLSGQAEAITELTKAFEKQDATLEDIILWYQDQLAKINEPLEGDLPFNESNPVVIETLQETLASLMKALTDARSMMKENQTRIQDLDKKLASQRKDYQGKIQELLGASRKELVALRKKYSNELSDKARKVAATERAELETEERFKYVKTMFDKREATISLKEKDVLIQVQGFRFSPGDAEIKARNFGLLNKVISAIQQFPYAFITISGHTDSVGNAEKNMALSTKRAANVEKFLVEVGGMSDNTIESKGYGETKPVASNNKRRGRAKNRRIEILIANK